MPSQPLVLSAVKLTSGCSSTSISSVVDAFEQPLEACKVMVYFPAFVKVCVTTSGAVLVILVLPSPIMMLVVDGRLVQKSL